MYLFALPVMTSFGSLMPMPGPMRIANAFEDDSHLECTTLAIYHHPFKSSACARPTKATESTSMSRLRFRFQQYCYAILCRSLGDACFEVNHKYAFIMPLNPMRTTMTVSQDSHSIDQAYSFWIENQASNRGLSRCIIFRALFLSLGKASL